MNSDSKVRKKDIPLYNSKIIKNFVEYLNEYHPDIDTNSLLNYAGITTYQIEDEGHWFTQQEINRFHEIMDQQTKDPDISRKVGRRVPFLKASRTASQYLLGFITPSVAYAFFGKLHHLFSRACRIDSKKIKSNKIQVVSIPHQDVEEKPFQCENRIGTLEAIAKIFTTKFATIEHPVCIHKGGYCCEYLITWTEAPSFIWKRFRNYLVFSSFVICLALFFVLSGTQWIEPVLIYILFVLIFSHYTEHMEKKEFELNLKNHGELANSLLDEINIRYNDAMLVHEIGQATSTILEGKKLLELVMEAMRNRLAFDRGIIMLANQDRTCLIYSVGYGYSVEQEELLRETKFHLDRPHSRGPVVESFRFQKPIFIDDISKIENGLSKKSQAFSRKMETRSFICVPIVFEKESLGILMVDNVQSKRSLRQSDVSLLTGIATQIAITLNNATSYQKVLESEERFRSLGENAPDIIYTLDVNGTFTYINPAWSRILGHDAKEVIGHYFIDFVKKEDQHEYIRLFKHIRGNKSTIRNRIGTLLHKDGSERFFNMSGAPNFDLDGNVSGVVGVFKDITESKKLESELLHAQKMEAVGTLAGGIAHDFNNLLMGIQGYASLMLFDMEPNHPHFEKLKKIDDQVRSGAELTKQLLGLARGGRYEIKVTDLSELIERTTSIFERTKKEISIYRRYESDLWAVEVDRGQIEQVILNLFVNAWQAMPGGGDLHVATANVVLNEEDVEPYGLRSGRYVMVMVTDTGIGMDERTRERIFEPFFTTKEMGRGTGLGLASAYGIIKGHGGIITVESEQGHGSTFTIYLPASMKMVERENALSGEMERGGETILLVDDEEVILDVSKEILEMLGYRVIVASSGRDALEVYRTRKDAIDLVILDMIMPGMGGGETLDNLRSIDPQALVILSSGYTIDGTSKKKLNQECDGFIQKPYNLANLSKKVREVLDSKKSLSTS